MGLQLKKKEAERIFKKLGIKKKNSSHHVRGFVELNGKKVIPLFYSHGNGDMPGNIPNKFRKSLRLNTEEFLLLKNCPMSKDEYLEILKNRIVL